MIVYEIYCCDKYGDEHLVGILPERRKESGRITAESILNWGKLILGDESDIKSFYLYFRTVEL